MHCSFQRAACVESDPGCVLQQLQEVKGEETISDQGRVFISLPVFRGGHPRFLFLSECSNRQNGEIVHLKASGMTTGHWLSIVRTALEKQEV